MRGASFRVCVFRPISAAADPPRQILASKDARATIRFRLRDLCALCG